MTHRAQLTWRGQLDDPKNKRDYNERMFTEVAPRYDLINRLLSFDRDQSWKDAMLSWLPDSEAPVCVDLACGTGDLTCRLASRYPNGKITGVDLTAGMLDIARKRCSLDNVEFCVGDMMQLDVSDASVDIVTGGYALRNAPDLEPVLREIYRTLKSGGTAAFLDFSRPKNGILQHIELALLRFWGGLWGLVLHGNPAIYAYIAESLKRFPPRPALKELMEDVGFKRIESQMFFFGVVELIFLRKAG